MHNSCRLLILQGSPRKESRVVNAASAISEIVKNAGGEIRVINTCQLQVRPCNGCMKCRETGICILPHDDMKTVADAIQWCNALVVAAPTYWANIPGLLKLLFDRMVPVLIKDGPSGHFPIPLHKGKCYAVITACSTPWPFNRLIGESSAMISVVKRIFRYSGFKYVGSIQMGGNRSFSESNCEHLAKALLRS